MEARIAVNISRPVATIIKDARHSSQVGYCANDTEKSALAYSMTSQQVVVLFIQPVLEKLLSYQLTGVYLQAFHVHDLVRKTSKPSERLSLGQLLCTKMAAPLRS